MEDATHKITKNIEDLKTNTFVSVLRTSQSINEKPEDFKLDDMTINISQSIPEPS